MATTYEIDEIFKIFKSQDTEHAVFFHSCEIYNTVRLGQTNDLNDLIRVSSIFVFIYVTKICSSINLKHTIKPHEVYLGASNTPAVTP